MLISSVVESVTLYQDRARVLRRGRAVLEKGQGRIEIQNLPRGIETDSARVRLRGNTRLLSLDLKTVNFVETPAQDARDMERAIEEKTDSLGIILRSLEQETGKADRARELSQESRSFARGLALGRMDIARQKEIFQFADEMQEQSSRSIARLEAEKRGLEKEIAKLRADLASRQSQRSRQRLDASIEYDCAEAGEVTVELVYVTRNAHWKPSYDLRFGERLDLHYMALASQSTGEEWSNVGIELSTAALSESETIPEFGAWYLRPFVPMPPPSMQPRGMPAPAPGMLAAVMAAPEEASLDLDEREEEKASIAQAEIKSGAVVTYGVQAKTNLPGNGETKKLTIALSDFPFEMDYVLAPAIQEVAYRRGEFENSSQLVLLSGISQVFFAEDLVGKTELEETIPAQKRKVFLGVESRIQVKRELKTHEADKKFLGDDRRLRWEYRIEIENLLEKDAPVLLREQIPVSAQEQIKVKFECAQKPLEKDMGTLEWTFQVPARGKKTLEYALVIEHPRSMQVQGLP
jgi:uncharacterized protein (TIGR02231 family)